jgi:hypothetical protein
MILEKYSLFFKFSLECSIKCLILIMLYASEPPSAPQNLTVNFVDQSTVILSWNAPHLLGGRTDTTYRVVCDACSSGVKYIPNTVS